MTGTNHALTGALIAGVVVQPILVIPLAFGSHFVLDSVPHFGDAFGHRHKLTKAMWAIDGVFVAALMLYLLFSAQPLIIFFGALAAMSPDFLWMYRFFIVERFGTLPPGPTNRFNAWHASIQHYETRGGLIVEVVYFAIAAVALWRLLG